MADMLVKLYDLKYDEELFNRLRDKGISVRRAKAPEKSLVLNWVKENFGGYWESECDVSFSNSPISCFIAIDKIKNKIVGFSCYDATCKDFFGPTGVDENYRGENIGKALLLIALKSMWEIGYAYAIIGGVGPIKFYEKAVNAILIENSEPGIYEGLLKNN
ncbi:GNAT family N-acetyltransferase [Petrotoga sp. 9PWA.NaAc.5.4]|uniref:GNAT family N-acetyltransferase n=1 Tax=Petrotoga sp. 9PWA.NaAc.5.4 TaxID=1434328 RepID=UPI000CB89D8E|nr:GNAT family N-acetyltransferase [Petrotoga sp. 9PWA.NaAc.5.4]PNR97176.1 GNAT family acetyltransferase [Petrotoga sp. 9PWA.NaAc.5.4]